MQHLEALAAEEARTQNGVVAADQLMGLGMTRRQIGTLLKSGVLVTVYPGVYAFRAVTLTWAGRLAAAQLRLGWHSVASHRSAGAWHRLDGVEPGVVEFTLTSGCRRPPAGVILHRRAIPSRDIKIAGSLRVTRIERTLVDLGAVLHPDAVEEAIECAYRMRLTRPVRLRRQVEAMRRRGVAGPPAVAAHLEARDPRIPAPDSVFETRFYRLLCRSPLPPHRRQFVVMDGVWFVARLDVGYPDRQVGVEALSIKHHSGWQNVGRDAERHNRLMELGWRILYVTYADMQNRPQQVLDRLSALLAEPS